MHICKISNQIARNACKKFFFASSIKTNFNIEILIDGVKFSLTSTKVKKIQGDPSLNMTKKNSDQGRAVFVKISKVGLLSLNPIFSSSNGPNVKISVPIRKRIALGFQNSPYF